MIVDCGGYMVNLTTRKLRIGEITEISGDCCGSTFVDKEFIKFLRKKLGTHAIDLLIETHYVQFQYMIQEFCRHLKIPFTGDDPNFLYEMDLEEVCPILLRYVRGEAKEKLKDDEGLIKFDYNTIKSMFDPVVGKIIHLINLQLSRTQEACEAIFLVGGFSENKYLQKRIKKEFHNRVRTILVPVPITAIASGAVIYGVDLCKIIHSAVI